jgi:LPS sulfotransferase NodH
MNASASDGPARFVLLGHARCGSNLLLRALIEHPEVRTAGEILTSFEQVRKISWFDVRASAWRQPRAEAYQTGQDAAKFLEEHMFGAPQVDGIRACGFKLFYDQARFDASVRTAWDYLLSHDIRVIHLVRRNLLYALISLEVARRTDEWHRLVEQGAASCPSIPPFELDVAACHQYFDNVTAYRIWATQALARHDVLYVEYEKDVCADFPGTMMRIFDFLGVSRQRPRPGLLKQQTKTAREQLTNFAQLRSYFRHTLYDSFFDNADSPDHIRPVTSEDYTNSQGLNFLDNGKASAAGT